MQKHPVIASKNGDFKVDIKFIFEIDRKEKSFDQIKEHEKAYLALDNIEVGKEIISCKLKGTSIEKRVMPILDRYIHDGIRSYIASFCEENNYQHAKEEYGYIQKHKYKIYIYMYLNSILTSIDKIVQWVAYWVQL